MTSIHLSKIFRTQTAAIALVLATVTVSGAANSRVTSNKVTKGQARFEYVPAQDTRQDSGWYEPAGSPQFSSYSH